MLLVLDLPPAADEDAVISAAAARGVGVDSMARHTTRPRGPGLILGYGRIAEAAIARGVRELAAAVTDATETS